MPCGAVCGLVMYRVREVVATMRARVFASSLLSWTSRVLPVVLVASKCWFYHAGPSLPHSPLTLARISTLAYWVSFILVLKTRSLSVLA